MGMCEVFVKKREWGCFVYVAFILGFEEKLSYC